MHEIHATELLPEGLVVRWAFMFVPGTQAIISGPWLVLGLTICPPFVTEYNTPLG